MMQPEKQHRSELCGCLQASLGDLAVFLGEKKEGDPAGTFALLNSFTKVFDSTLVQVAKRNFELLDEEEAPE